MNETNTDNQIWERGRDLYEAGHHWRAHEAWEELWLRTQDSAEANLLRAAIQVAAAMVKAEQGNMAGVQKNLKKARENLITVPQKGRQIETQALVLDCDRCIRHAQAIRNAGSYFDWSFKPKIIPLSKA